MCSGAYTMWAIVFKAELAGMSWVGSTEVAWFVYQGQPFHIGKGGCKEVEALDGVLSSRHLQVYPDSYPYAQAVWS